MSAKPCINCSGRGWHWRRGSQGTAHMIKTKCFYCEGTGKSKEKPK